MTKNMVACLLALLMGVVGIASGQEMECEVPARVWWVPLANPSPDSPIQGFPVVWIFGIEGPRVIGPITFGARQPRVISVGVACDPSTWSQVEIAVHDLRVIDGNIVLAPNNSTELATGVDRGDVWMDFTPQPEETLEMLSVVVTAEGIFQHKTMLGECSFRTEENLSEWWCFVVDGTLFSELPLLSLLFTPTGKLVGRTRGISDPQAPRVLAEFFSGSEGWTEAAQLAVPIENPIEVPSGFWVDSAWPNPTAGHAEISVRIDTPQHIRVEVFNTAGRSIETLVVDYVSSGEHTLRFNGDALPSGLYLVRITGERAVQTVRVVLIHQ